MKKDLENRLQTFETEAQNFAARWNQLKPSNIDSDSSPEEYKKASESIKERKKELEEVLKNKEKLQ